MTIAGTLDSRTQDSLTQDADGLIGVAGIV
jgi:hypothetical protein